MLVSSDVNSIIRLRTRLREHTLDAAHVNSSIDTDVGAIDSCMLVMPTRFCRTLYAMLGDQFYQIVHINIISILLRVSSPPTAFIATISWQ